MRKAFMRALGTLVCFALLFSFNVPGFAKATGNGTNISITVERFKITSHTDDFTMCVGENQQLMVYASETVQNYIWEISTDGGISWANAVGATNAPTYNIAAAQPNTDTYGRDVAYQYRVTATGASGDTDSAIICVLVSDSYAYRTVAMRDGFTDVTAYMHDQTRLVVTPLSDSSPAATELEAELSDGCLPLIICDISLVNQNNQVVPYFGELQVDFHVGDAYNGQTLRAYHLTGGGIVAYSGIVGSDSSGVLSVTVNTLSPFMLEVPAANTRTVTVSAGAGGTATPSGRVNMAAGADKTFIFLPDAGCAIDRVMLDGAPVSITGNSYTLTNITGNHAVNVSFRRVAASDTLHTVTITGGAHGAVSPSGAMRVRHGCAQTVYFYPDSGYELDSVQVNGAAVSVIGNSYTLSAVEGNAAVKATFRAAATQPPNIYKTVTASAGAGGSISPAGNVSVEYGGDMYFYFIPDSGYAIDEVFIDGAAAAAGVNFHHFINIIDSHTIHVTFKHSVPPPQPSVYRTVTAGSGDHGGINPAGNISVPDGGAQTFVFTPDAGYEVDTVSVDGTAVNVSGNTYTFTGVTAEHIIYVTFKPCVTPPSPTTYHTVTAGSGDHGGISPAGNIPVPDGGAQTFVFTPDAGYEVDTVIIDGTQTSVFGSSYRFSYVASNHTISVTFKKIAAPPDPVVYHTISAEAGKNGAVSPNGDVQIAAGRNVCFYFLPDDGYEVDEVTVDGKTIQTAENSYCFESVDAAHSILVTFKQSASEPEPTAYHTVFVSAEGNGSISPSGNVQVANGGSQTFYFIADDGYEVDVIYVNGEKQAVAGGRFTVDNITDDTRLSVVFKPIADPAWGDAYHCFLCGWLGRNIAPWCLLIPLIIAIVAGGAAVYICLRRRRSGSEETGRGK